MTAPAFYSEHDPHAAAWLRELIKADLIPPGVVDERDIRTVSPTDLRGFHAVHLFAGIGGWPYALRLAGWPDDRPVWTGSCPCQPYSAAGRGLGDKDPRNLWPAMFGLVRECRPDVIFGEQVENAIKHGWLDRISADLEGEGYAVGAAVLGAHSLGAPHIRQRLYWLADAESERRHRRASGAGERGADAPERLCTPGAVADTGSGGTVGGRGHDMGGAAGQDGSEVRQQRVRAEPRTSCVPGRGVGNPRGQGRQTPEREAVPGARRREEGRTVAESGSPPDPARPVGHTNGQREGAIGGVRDRAGAERPGGVGFWSEFDILECRDGRSRRSEPGVFPLAHGVSGRVGMLRGYGNAIVPQVAAEFVRAYLDVSAGQEDE